MTVPFPILQSIKEQSNLFVTNTGRTRGESRYFIDIIAAQVSTVRKKNVWTTEINVLY